MEEISQDAGIQFTTLKKRLFDVDSKAYNSMAAASQRVQNIQVFQSPSGRLVVMQTPLTPNGDGLN